MLIRQVLNRIGEDADAGGDGFSGVELGQYYVSKENLLCEGVVIAM